MALDYQGNKQPLADCVKITLGEFEGQLILADESTKDPGGDVYPSNMDGMDDYVITYDGKCLHVDDATCLTCGKYEDEWASDDEVSNYRNDYFLTDYASEAGYCMDYNGDFHPEDDCVILTGGRHEGEWAHMDEVSSFEDEYWLSDYDRPDSIVIVNGDYEWRDNCSYCDSCGEYYRDDSPCCPDEENNSEDHINQYHSSPSPSRYGNWDGNAIGFEVEKKQINGCDSSGEYIGIRPLFCGVETDSSCGVEAITHIYSLDDEGWQEFQHHVARSEDWLEEEVDSSCGGHVNVSGANVNLENIRRYAGLLYALYRFRLNNSYSCCDKGLRGSSDRYCPIRMKRTGLAEFRLVSRVKNAWQIKWRFRLFRLMMDCLDKGASFRHFMEKARPLMREAYPDKGRRAEIRMLARHFNRYLQEGVIHHSISKFV